MLDFDIVPGASGDIDDIEFELCSSSREASVGFVPFANLDMWDIAHKFGLSQTEHGLRASWRR